MLDKGHCMMSMDSDQEFEIFYDFRRAYTDLQVKRKLKTIQCEDPMDQAEREHDMMEERKIKSD